MIDVMEKSQREEEIENVKERRDYIKNMIAGHKGVGDIIEFPDRSGMALDDAKALVILYDKIINELEKN